MKKFIAASAIALALVAGSFASKANAATIEELQAMIAQLTAQLASLSGGTSVSTGAGYMFNSDLTIGSTGADVSALQSFLVSKGFLSMPAGVAMGNFGQLTKSAVMAYQTSVGVSATGYVGPMTRAKLNASSVTTTTTTTTTTTGTTGTVSLSGGEGELTSIDTIGGVESTVDEGSEEQVLGVEVEAKDSDVMIERVDVDFTKVTSGGSSKFDDYVDSVKLVIDGKTVATADADEADEDDDVYSFRFSGLKSVVTEDDTAEIYVVVEAVSNLDSSDADKDWSVEIPDDGIRATDAAGISETYVSNDSLSEEFSIDTATDGELDVSEADESPEASTVKVDDENDTKDVVLLALDLEAKEQDVNIDSLQIALVASGAGAGEIVKSVMLKQGSKTLDTVNVSSTTATTRYVVFTDLDLDISEDDTETLTIVADINDLDGAFTAGDSVYALATSSTTWDVEDSEGEDITPDGDVTGEAQSFFMDGISVVKKSVKAVTTDESDTYPNSRGVYTIEFDVTAFGEDAYIASTTNLVSASGDHGVEFSIIGGTFSGTTTAVLSSEADEENASYRVREGDTETFTLEVVLLNGIPTSGTFGIELNTIRFDDADSAAISAYAAFTSDLDSIETTKIILQ